jgi:predicted RNA binding protein YcfA (HicA-like mRNA interferase family)
VTRLDDAIARLRGRPSEANFEDVRRVLEAHGWTQERQRGSHVTFAKPGERSLVVPLSGRNKVKRHYVATVCNRLGLDDQR